jgi:hypothetical protein
MCKLHTSRLMRGGEYALWRGGRIIRSGNVGERIDDIAFDAVSLSIDDGVQLLERTGGVLTADMARATLSNWWE